MSIEVAMKVGAPGVPGASGSNAATQGAAAVAGGAPAEPRRRKPMLAYVHAFRAAAILFIVAGHCVRLFDWSGTPRVELFLLDALENGTVLFVFIAGYLFEYLADRFNYRDYLRTKLRNVIAPYLIIMIPALVHDVWLVDASIANPRLAGEHALYQAAWHLLVGGAGINFPMWFIPMIALYYVAAPIFMLIARRPVLFWSIPLLLVLSTLLHRPSPLRLDTLIQAAYYLCAYVTGMWVSRNRDVVEPWLRRHWLPICAAVAVMIVAQWRWGPFHGNYNSLGSFSREHGWIDWLFLQKLLMCFAFIGFLGRWYTRSIPLVDRVADLSFPIFFVHAYFIFLQEKLYPFGQAPGGLAGYLVTVVSVTAASLLLVMGIRKLAGERSRWIIGA